MKKNFFKKLAATLALAMVVTSVAPAATASAATGITGAASTIYATKAYSLKLGAGVNAKWTSSNKAIATVGLTGGKLKATKAGKVTITAKSTKTGKSYKKTFVVKQRATSVELGNDLSLAVGATSTLKAVLTPATSTDVVRYVSNNKEVATVGLTGGKVTAKKAGEATITVYAKATTASATASKMNKVDTIKVKVGTFIEGVAQNSTTKLDVTFNADMKDAKAADFKIVKDDTNYEVAVKGIKVDGKKVTVETYSDINDGATYTVTHGESDYKFVATNGKVATLAIGPATITKGKETEMTLYAKDANGVIVKEFKYDKEDSEYDFKIETTDGYTTGSDLVLNDVGDTAKATATYHTYEYDDNGKEVGAITVEQTITAVDATAFAAGEYKYSVEKTDDGEPNWNDFTANTKLAIDEDNDYSVYVYLEDKNGDEVDNEDYSLESSNDDVLVVNDSTGSASINAEVRAVDKGTAYVLVKNDDDKVVLSLPVTIVAERKTAALVLSNTSIKLSNTLADTATVDVDVKDQYGKDLAEVDEEDIDVECVSTSADDIDDNDVTEGNGYFDVNDGEIIFNGLGITEGTYKYKVTVDDYSKYVSVKVENPGALDKDDVSYKLIVKDKEKDIIVKSGNTTDYTMTVKVARLNDGVTESYVSIASLSDVTIKRDGDKVSTEWLASYASIIGGALEIDALAFAADGSDFDVTKVDTGSYSVEVEISDSFVIGGTTYTKNLELDGGFVIKDSQAGVTFSLENKEVDAATMKAAIAEAFEFKYRGDDLNITASDILKYEVDGKKYGAADVFNARDGRSYRIDKVTFEVSIEIGSTDYNVPITVKVGKTISIED